MTAKYNETIGCLGCLAGLVFCLSLLGAAMGVYLCFTGEESIANLLMGLAGACIIGWPAFRIYKYTSKKADKNKELNLREEELYLEELSSRSNEGDSKSQFVCKSCKTVCRCGISGEKGKFQCPGCKDGKAKWLGDCCVNHTHPISCKSCEKEVLIYSWTGKKWENS